jgi:hypothetical protein
MVQVMGMRLLVVVAARAAEEEQNFLSIFSHDDYFTGFSVNSWKYTFLGVGPSGDNPMGRSFTSIRRSHLPGPMLRPSGAPGMWPQTSNATAYIPIAFNESDRSLIVLKSNQEPLTYTPGPICPEKGTVADVSFNPAALIASSNCQPKFAFITIIPT